VALSLGQRLKACDEIAYARGSAVSAQFMRLVKMGFSPESALKQMGLPVPDYAKGWGRCADA
jgi:hypothetical protein